MSLINSHDLEDNKIFVADICIIGAGMAGQIIAKFTSENGLKTLVLESGDEKTNEDTESLNYFDTRHLSQLRKNHKNRIRQIGGSVQYPWLLHHKMKIFSGDENISLVNSEKIHKQVILITISEKIKLEFG